MDLQHIIQPQFESMHGAAQFVVSACFYQMFGFSGLRTRADTNVTPVKGGIPLAKFWFLLAFLFAKDVKHSKRV